MKADYFFRDVHHFQCISYGGGRCSAASALLGGALALHPMIVVKDGKMDASKKYRGKIGKVILSYTHDLESALKDAYPDRVFITHSQCGPGTLGVLFISK